MAAPRPVELTIPAEAASVRLARLIASGIAADAGFDVEDCEDLRIAVSELVALLIEGAEEPSDRLTLTYIASPGQMRVEGIRPLAPDDRGTGGGAGGGGGGDVARAALDDLALEILRVVVDEHDFVIDGAGRRFHLVKRGRAGG